MDGEVALFLLACCVLAVQPLSISSVYKPYIKQTVHRVWQNTIDKGRHPHFPDLDFVAGNQIEAYYYGIYGDLQPPDGNPQRAGSAMNTSSCNDIRAVPERLRAAGELEKFGLSVFYQKYTEAYDIPVLGSKHVNDAALRRACYVLRFILADIQDLRQRYYSSRGRVVILAANETVLDLPEYKFLPESFADTPGLGAVPVAPISSASETNVLCDKIDPNNNEDILLREIAQGVHHLAAKTAIHNFQATLQQLYDNAIASGWWKNTYAALSPDAYFGEGIQSYFSVNGYSRFNDGGHGHVNTRVKLQAYDPALYDFIRRLFPCENYYTSRCLRRGNEHLFSLRTDCISYGPIDYSDI